MTTPKQKAVLRQKAYVGRKRASGKCARCSAPSEHWRCATCEAKHNVEVKLAYQKKFAKLVKPVDLGEIKL